MFVLWVGTIIGAGFDQIFNMYNPAVYATGDIIDTYVYRTAFSMGGDNYGTATAAGLFKSVISLGPAGRQRLSRRIGEEIIFERGRRNEKRKNTAFDYMVYLILAVLGFYVSSPSGMCLSSLCPPQIPTWRTSSISCLTPLIFRVLPNPGFQRFSPLLRYQCADYPVWNPDCLGADNSQRLCPIQAPVRPRKVFNGLIMFTMLFSGGMIPSYIVVTRLGLANKLPALFLPMACSAYNLIITKNFMTSLPVSLEESARIDGALTSPSFLKSSFRFPSPLWR